MSKPLTPKDWLRQASENLGGQAALAALLGYKDRRNVAPWFTTERDFPAEHCPTVEGALRALGPDKVVTCEQLRPDVSWDVLRAAA